MTKKRYVVYAVVFLVLTVLVYLQFRTWQNFDWVRFRETRPQKWNHILHGIALIYLAYVARAIRWKIFLRPVRPQASSVSLVAPTIIGFTGLALLGRPGELIRPYLIARRQNLSFSSQLGVWAVERIFDFGAFTVLLVSAILVSAGPRSLPFYHRFREGGFLRFRSQRSPSTGRAKPPPIGSSSAFLTSPLTSDTRSPCASANSAAA